MEEIPKSLTKFAAALFKDERRDRFVAAINGRCSRAPAIAWLRPRVEPNPFAPVLRAGWQPDFVDRLTTDVRAGQNPLHDQGYFYCLDSSSVFEAVPLTTLPPGGLVIDLCASPGGKSVLASRILNPRRLLSNEVIGKRTAQLIANLSRCEIPNTTVTRNDSAVFAQCLACSADVVLVDAPCSGQSLLAKGCGTPAVFIASLSIAMPTGSGEFLLTLLTQSLREEASYTTCTFAVQENEKGIEWLCKRFPDLQAQEVPALAEFRSEYADFPCYRLWPFQGFGAGGFTALLKDMRTPERKIQALDLSPLRVVWHSPGLSS